jgi:hypothetical protein
MIGGFIYGEILLFHWFMIKQNRYRLYRFSVFLYTAATIALLVLCLEEEGLNSLIYAAAVMILGLLHHKTLFEMKDSRWLSGDSLLKSKIEFSTSGFLSGFSALCALTLIPESWGAFQWLAGGVISILILLAYKASDSRGLRSSVVIYLILFTTASFMTLLEMELPLNDQGALSLALAVTAGLTFFWKESVHKIISYTGLLISTGTILIISYLTLNSLSFLLPGLFWLGVVIILMEMNIFPERFRSMAVIFMGAFIIRHFMVHMVSTQTWGVLPLRYLMDGALMITLFFLRRHSDRV